MASGIQQKLWDAAFQLDLNSIKKQIKQGGSIRKGDKDGCDVLYHAVSCIWDRNDPETAAKQKEVIELLIKEGADIHVRYTFVSGWTPLMLAASSGMTGALEVLIAAGADVEATDSHGYTPLMRAALGGHARAVALLLDHGADAEKKTGKESALGLALEGQKEDSGQTGADFKQTIALLKKALANSGDTHPAKPAVESAREDKSKKNKPAARQKPGEKSTTQKAMEEKFRPHPLPTLLADLCDYWDNHPVHFCGSFEIDEDASGACKAWFRGKEAGWSRIRLFGIDGIHSLYGIWLYEGRTSENAPIVYLGGEGEGTTILAGTWNEFLSILAANQEWEPFDKEFFDAADNNEEENAAFQEWLEEAHGITPAGNPMKILRKAKNEHPDFDEWLRTVRPGWNR